MEPCPICSNEIEFNSLGSKDAYSVKCPQCGNYALSRSSLVNLRNAELTDRQRANISGWLIENEGYEINTYNLDDFLVKLRTPGFIEKSDSLLSYIARKSECAGTSVFYDLFFISHASCVNEFELHSIVRYLVESERIYKHGGKSLKDQEYIVAPNGWIRVEELSETNTGSMQGFVAMWFDDKMISLYSDAIAPAIADAGYNPHRVDLREHNDKIDDEIISQIRRSRFVVADFTGHRGGVYFEAGFAKGLGLEVFWLCNEKDLKDLHFDIRQYNCITWTDDNKKDLRQRLTLRIESVLGAGR